MPPAIDFDALAGKPGPASVLLRCIAEQHAWRSVDKAGHRVCPVARATLLRHSRLSLDQYHRALRRLCQLRLVATRMGYFKAVRMPHFELAGALRQALEGGVGVQSTAIQGGEIGTSQPVDVQLTAIQGGEIATTIRAGACAGARAGLESKKEKKAKKVSKQSSKAGVRSHAAVTGADVKQATGEQGAGRATGKKPSRYPPGRSVAEILAETQKAPASAPDSPSLEWVWRQACLDAYGGFVAPVTIKERAQLKHFVKSCPEGGGVAVLRHVVAEWATFVHFAQAEAGAYSLPGKPSVGFVVKYLGAAVNLWLEAGKAAAAIAPAATPTTAQAAPPPVPAAAPKAMPKPSADKASLDEVLALLGVPSKGAP